MKPIFKLTKDVNVGIFDGEYQANVYADKIIVTVPEVKWIGNTGGYNERKESIREPKIINRVLQELKDGAEDTAWHHILRNVDNNYRYNNPIDN